MAVRNPLLFLAFALLLAGRQPAAAQIPIHTGQSDLVPGLEASTYTLVRGDASTGLLYAVGGVNTANGFSTSVAVVDAATGLVIKNYAVPVYSPRDAALDPAAHLLYLVGDSATLAVLNVQTGGVSTLTLNESRQLGVALDPALHRAYLLNYFESTISVVDTGSLTVSASIATGSNPSRAAVNPANHELYVACTGNGQASGEVDIYSGSGGSLSKTHTLSLGATQFLAFDPASAHLFVWTGTSVTVVDPQTQATLDTLSVPACSGFAVDNRNGGDTVYVFGSSGISGIDGATDAVTALTTSNSLGLALDATGVLHSLIGPALDAYSAAGTFQNTAILSPNPQSVAVDAPQQKIYVTDSNTNSLLIVSRTTGAIIGNIPFEQPLGEVVVNASRDRAYVLTPGDSTLTAIDTTNDHIIYHWPVTVNDPDGNPLSFSPTHLAVDVTHNRIYVVQPASPGYLSVVDGAVEAAGQDPVNHQGLDEVGDSPTGLAIDEAANLLFVNTMVNNGTQDAAAIVVKAPGAGAPVATIFDPGANETTPNAALVLNPVTHRLYVNGLNPGTGTPEIKVIPTASGTGQYQITSRVGSFPGGLRGPLAVNTARDRVYLLAASGSGTLLRTITQGTLDPHYDATPVAPNGFAWDPASANLYVSTFQAASATAGAALEIFFDGADSTHPSQTVTQPAEGSSSAASLLRTGVVSISGGRSDTTAVSVSIRNAQGLYWDGAGWSTSESFLTALPDGFSAGNWNFDFPTAAQGFGKGDYTLHVKTLETDGLTTESSSHFTIITPGSFSFSLNAYTVAENAGQITIAVNRTGGTDGPVTMHYRTRDGTAHSYEGAANNPNPPPLRSGFGDYVLHGQTRLYPDEPAKRLLTFADGQQSASFQVDVSSDTLVEGPQTVNLILEDFTAGAEPGTNPAAVLTITDDSKASVSPAGVIPLQPAPQNPLPAHLAIDPAGGKIYALGATVSVIDAATGMVTGGFVPEALSEDVAVDPALNRLYVTGLARGESGEYSYSTHYLRVFDLTTRAKIKELLLPGAENSYGLSLDRQTHRLYINTTVGRLTVYDGIKGELVFHDLAGGGGFGQIDELRHQLVGFDSGGVSSPGVVYFTDVNNGKVTSKPLSLFPYGYAINNVTGVAYACGSSDDGTSGALFAIDTGTMAVTTVPLAYPASSVTVDETNNIVYVGANEAGNNGRLLRIHAFNGATNAETGVVGSSSTLYNGALAVLPARHQIYVAPRSGVSGVGVFDLQAGTDLLLVTAPSPASIVSTHTAAGDKTYAADSTANVIYVIDESTNTVLRQIRTPGIPGALTSIDATGKVYFATLLPDATTGANSLVLHSLDIASDTVDSGSEIIGSPSGSYNALTAVRLLADAGAKKLFTYAGATIGGQNSYLYKIEADPAQVQWRKVIATGSFATGTGLEAIDPVQHHLYGTSSAYVSGHTEVHLNVLDETNLTVLSSTTIGQDFILGNVATVDSAAQRLYYVQTYGGREVTVLDIKPGSATENKIISTLTVTQKYQDIVEYGLETVVVNPSTHHLFLSDFSGNSGQGTAVVLKEGNLNAAPALAEIQGEGIGAAFNSSTQRLSYTSPTMGLITAVLDGADLQPLPAPSKPAYSVSDQVAGVPWSFTSMENSTVAGISVLFQYSPDNGASWSTLPGAATQSGTTWSLVTAGVPSGSITFRALATAAGFADSASDPTVPVTVAPAPAAPPGRGVQFGDVEYSGNAGATVAIPVVLGTSSTGQVLAPFTISGDAVAYTLAKKPYDYTLTDPPNGTQTVVFGPGEKLKFIYLKVAQPKTPQPVKTVVLTLTTPVGNAELGDPVSVTIGLNAGHAAVLHKPAGLIVAPANVVSAGHGQPVVARSGSDWKFSVSEPAVAQASDLGVTIQTAGSLSGPWTDLIALAGDKGKWTGSTRRLAAASVVYFRAIARATGFPDFPGDASKPFGVVPGPDLTLKITAHSDSDSSGASVHESEVITYHLVVANNGEGAATNAVVTVPIPPHAAYINASTQESASLTTVPDHDGKVASVQWKFPTIPAHVTDYTQDLFVQVDESVKFSANNPSRGFGYQVELAKFSVASPQDGVKAGTLLNSTVDTVIHGPISLAVTASASSVQAGDLLTYTLTARNDSSNGVAATVTDHIPAGTVLETVYNADGTALPNPGPLSTPQVLYTPNPKGPTLDPSQYGSTVVRALIAGFIKSGAAKKVPEYDFVALRVQTQALSAKAHRADPNQSTEIASDMDDYDAAIAAAVKSQLVLPSGLKWETPVPAQTALALKFSVRLLGDAVHPGTATVVNDRYDFTIPADNDKTLSALYGRPLVPVVTSIIPGAGARPEIYLNKYAIGDGPLVVPSKKSGGYQYKPGLGLVAQAAQGQGFDMELSFGNRGSAPARNFVIHDVIPEGTELVGFLQLSLNGATPAGVNAGQWTCYDALGNLMPSVDGQNITKVRSMDLRLSQQDNLTPLQPGDTGYFRYTLVPTIAPAPAGKTPNGFVAVGGYQPDRKRSDPLQGAFISTTDLALTEPAYPTLLPVIVANPISFSPEVQRLAQRAVPGFILPFNIVFTQNGDTDAQLTHITFTVPQGTVLMTDDAHKPRFLDGSGTPIQTDTPGHKADLQLGLITAHSSRAVRINLLVATVNGGLDPALQKSKYVVIPDLSVGYIKDAAEGAPYEGRHTADATYHNSNLVSNLAPAPSPVPVRLSGAQLGIVRSAPYSIGAGDQFSYIIAFTNAGDDAAQNVQVGMQIPWGTQFVSADHGIIITQVGGAATAAVNSAAPDQTPRSADQVSGTGPGPDILTWHFASLPAYSSGVIKLTVKGSGNFKDGALTDHSLYISATNAASAVISPDPIGLWVCGGDFESSKKKAFARFCDLMGIPRNTETSAILQDFEQSFTVSSRVHAISNLDVLQIEGGPDIIPLQNNQVLVLQGIVAQGGTVISWRRAAATW